MTIANKIQKKINFLTTFTPNKHNILFLQNFTTYANHQRIIHHHRIHSVNIWQKQINERMKCETLISD